MTTDREYLPERDEIAKETNVLTLSLWHDDAVDMLDRLKAQLTAHNMIDDHSDEDYSWANRVKLKAGYAGTALRRIERRLILLGLPLPLTVDRKERERIRYLEERIGFLKTLCISHGIDTNPDKIKRR